MEIPTPTPGPGEVLVRVRAVSLNYRDLGTSRRERPGNLPLPFTLGSDCAGEVAALGAGVTQWKEGDRVIPAFFQNWPAGGMTQTIMRSALGGALQGVLAEYMIARADALVHLPATLDFSAGATLPCAGVTAWNALVGQGQMLAGQTVLTLGTGGVSIFALQFAKHMGRVSSSPPAAMKNSLEPGSWERMRASTTRRLQTGSVGFLN
nr:NAD(P)-dependent alcohol dehydrogenase [Verrucomicrobium spinosum]